MEFVQNTREKGIKSYYAVAVDEIYKEIRIIILKNKNFQKNNKNFWKNNSMIH